MFADKNMINQVKIMREKVECGFLFFRWDDKMETRVFVWDNENR